MYKKLPDTYFFWAALVIQVIIVVLAISITDIKLVYEIAGAVGGTSILFLFPGVAYILVLRKYGKPSHRELWSSFFWHSLAWFFVLCALLILVAFFYVEFGKLFGYIPKEVEA